MKQEKGITIYDIARQLNISAATVSRALQDHETINKNIRKKIFDWPPNPGTAPIILRAI